jgi:hypothetical protein
MNVVFFLLGDSPASEFYMPTFRYILFNFQRDIAYEDGTERSETSEYKIQMPGNPPKERIRQFLRFF